MNGAARLHALHRVLSGTGTTGALSSGWGEVRRGPDQAADSPGGWVEVHINEKEAHALLRGPPFV